MTSRVDVVVIGRTSDVRAVAEELAASQTVVFVTDRHDQARAAERAGVSTHRTTFETGLGREGVAAEAALVATEEDAVNLLLTQHLRVRGDVDTVITRINDETRRVAFDDVATETLTPAETDVRTVRDTLEAS
ncbi:NAD-binding protein [Halorhabdus tiamatea]|nr:NAD-binding protein [Halorhabdus tiamatea]